MRLKVIKQMYASRLDNYRDILVYLPKNYEKNEKRYNVIYFHDGMECFFKEWSLSGESWKVNEVIDKLVEEKKIEETIIVGIPNNYDRMSELAHFDFKDKREGKEFIEGKGILYEDFLINEVKPYIDKNFRTKPEREYNTLIGSSMGGMVTFNIGMRHPEVFSKLGVLSPAFWMAYENGFNEIKKYNYNDFKIWMDYGTGEGKLITEPSKSVGRILLENGYKYRDEFILYEDLEAPHNEGAWNRRLRDVLLYLLKGEECEKYNLVSEEDLNKHKMNFEELKFTNYKKE